MAERYDLTTPRKYKDREGNDKTYWMKVGVAFAKPSGEGFNLTLEAYPVPQMNDKGKLEVFISMLPPFEKD
jgi:hypothetical protein